MWCKAPGASRRAVHAQLCCYAPALCCKLLPVSLKGITRRSISAQILRFIIRRLYSVCRFSQNWASTPKYLCSLKAVSAVMDLFPFTISLILLGGTERSRESWLMLMPKGSRKSSRRISPGFIGSRFFFCTHRGTSVIVCNFNMVRIAVIPFETYAPLLIDTDSILPFSIPGKGMKFVSWVKRQRFYAGSGMKNHQPFSCLPFKGLKTAYPSIIK